MKNKRGRIAALALSSFFITATLAPPFITTTTAEPLDKTHAQYMPYRLFPIDMTITSAEPADQGTPLALYPVPSKKQNTQRAYIEATPNKHYAVTITNKTTDRIGIVIAIDGRNIITGDYSNLSPREAMYIIEPLQTATYKGWRTSQDRINTFYFTDAADSYAAAFGDRSAIGVIAIAAYRELHPIPPITPQQEYSKGLSPGAAHDSRQAEQPGTGFGDPEHSPSIMVKFKPDPNTLTKYLVKYEWRDTLCKKRIIDCDSPKNRLWDDNDHYAPYPPNKYR